MFTSPVATLESLRERPQWFYPVLLAAAFSVVANFYVIQRIGLERLVSAMAQAGVALDPQAAVQNAMAHQSQIFTVQALSTVVNVFLTALVIAKVFWLLLTLCGVDISYKKILAIVAHANMLAVVLRECMLVLTATFIRDLSTLDLRNPLATNLAFFAAPKSPVAFHILSSLDVITFVNVYFLVVGLTKVCARLSLSAASVIVVVPWAFYVAATLLLPSIMS